MSNRAEPSEPAFWGDSTESEALRNYRVLANTIGDGIYQLDCEDCFVAINEAFAEMTGYARTELLDEHVSMLLEEGATFERDLERLCTDSAERSELLEVPVRTSDGERGRYEIRVNAFEADDAAKGTVGIVRDVSEQHRTNLESGRSQRQSGSGPSDPIRTFQEDEEWLRLALEAGEMGAWKLDLQTNDSPVRSPQHDRIFGYEEPLEDWSLDIFLDHVHPDDRTQVKRRFEDAFETGTWQFDCRIIRADGERRWISAQGEFYYDGDGEPVRAIGVVEDITDQKARERDLNDAKSQLEAAAEAGAVGTWEWHVPEDRMVTGDPFARTLGIDPEAAHSDVSLDQFISSVHEDDQERVERDIRAALESCGEYESEYRVWNAEDELRWVVARGHVNCDEDGNPTTFPGALTDITERKKYERKLEASNERLERFAYAASHDLQEPLRMVSSYLKLIENRYAADLDEDGREFIEFAVDGADRMRDMIDGLLEYSQIETQGDPFEPVDLDVVLEDVRNDLQLQIAETGAEITSEPLPRVEVDASQVRQVFQNLLTNALIYSGDDIPRIHVDSREWGRRQLVSVRDEGIGIDTENQHDVFDVFERLQTREEHAGTGIGLALCKRIIERHGGDIWVDSEPGEGSTFMFTLPTVDD